MWWVWWVVVVVFVDGFFVCFECCVVVDYGVLF